MDRKQFNYKNEQRGKRVCTGKMPFEYYEIPKLAIAGKMPEPTGNGKIVIVTGGTSDMPVAEEAALRQKL